MWVFLSWPECKLSLEICGLVRHARSPLIISLYRDGLCLTCSLKIDIDVINIYRYTILHLPSLHKHREHHCAPGNKRTFRQRLYYTLLRPYIGRLYDYPRLVRLLTTFISRILKQYSGCRECFTLYCAPVSCWSACQQINKWLPLLSKHRTPRVYLSNSTLIPPNSKI
jgi:hypothetical protein